MTDRVLEGGTTTRVLEGGTTVRILEGSPAGSGLDQDVSLLYNSNKTGTSSSNIKFEEIDKNVNVKLR